MIRRVISILMVFMLFGFNWALACGPIFPSTIFSYSSHPDLPLSDFAKGELGILEPDYGTSFLITAYRYITGPGLDKKGQDAFVSYWDEKFFWGEDENKKPEVRLKTFRNIERFRKESKVNAFTWYLNCTDDAFDTAERTFQERIRQFGAESPEVKEWLSAQQIVFSNCEKGQAIPPPVTEGMGPLIKADRAYQIAAAYFYSGDFDRAEGMFREIAKDKSSPWRELAPYLAVRCIIRKTSLGLAEGNEKALFLKAKDDLEKILADPNLNSIHPASVRLLNLVIYSLNPAQRMADLAQGLVTKNEGIRSMLEDFLYIVAQGKTGDDDLSTWIGALHSKNVVKSLEKWRNTHSLVWLLAALSTAKPGDTNVPGLISDAEKINSSSPAYLSIKYYQLRLLLETGEKEKVRRELDRLLSEKKLKLPPSARNRFLSLRMQAAQDMKEFLFFAKRKAVAIFRDESANEIPFKKDQIFEEDFVEFKDSYLMDIDSVRVFNEKMPLGRFKEASESPLLPGNLQKDIAISLWARAILLKNKNQATGAAKILEQEAPELKEEMESYVSSSEPEKEFTAALIMLRNPGIQPYLREGVGRYGGSIGAVWGIISLDRLDHFRDNWWCNAAANWQAAGKPGIKAPDFLSESERNEAQAERDVLLRVSPGPLYLGLIVLSWAKNHPDDSRVPEALHLVVRATRYGCPEESFISDTSNVSKAAFKLLHQKYPDDPWTAKTPFWF